MFEFEELFKFGRPYMNKRIFIQELSNIRFEQRNSDSMDEIAREQKRHAFFLYEERERQKLDYLNRRFEDLNNLLKSRNDV